MTVLAKVAVVLRMRDTPKSPILSRPPEDMNTFCGLRSLHQSLSRPSCHHVAIFVVLPIQGLMSNDRQFLALL